LDSPAYGTSEKYVPALPTCHIWGLVFAAYQVLLYCSLTKEYPWWSTLQLCHRGGGH